MSFRRRDRGTGKPEKPGQKVFDGKELDVSIDISKVETTDEWGDEAVEAMADRAPRNLDEMLEVLRANAVWPGAPLAHGKLDWASLPVYGGPEVPDPIEVWSWDEERMLVGACSEELRIVGRAEGPS